MIHHATVRLLDDETEVALAYRFYPGLAGSYFEPPEPASIEIVDSRVDRREFWLIGQELDRVTEWVIENHLD